MKDEFAQIQELIDGILKDNPTPRVLEAGCGSLSHFDFGDAYIAGIDISQMQLDRNEKLDEKILGDLQAHDFGSARFDIIICYDVLEHLPEPGKAMQCLSDVMDEDGLFIIAVPNVMSVKGLVTKFTPHWFHIAYYRYILKYKDAGKNDQAPFPTFLRFEISPNSIEKFARKEGLGVDFASRFSGESQKMTSKKHRLFQIVTRTVNFTGKTLRLATLGNFDGENSTYFCALRKKVERAAVEAN